MALNSKSYLQNNSLLANLITLLLFLISGLLLFYNVLSNFYLQDDFGALFILRESPFETGSGFFRPLRSLSHFFVIKFLGDKPHWHLLVNIFIHSFNSFLVYATSRKLFNSNSSRYIPLIAGLLFLVLPVHSESVAWISGRESMLSVTFYLISFNLYLYYKDNAKLINLLCSLMFYLFSLLTYEASLTFPLTIFAYEAYLYFKNHEKNISPLLKNTAAFILVIVLSLVVRFYGLEETFIGRYGRNALLNFNLFSILKNVSLYTLRIIIPPFISNTSFIICLTGVFILIAFAVYKKFKLVKNLPFIFIFLIISFYISLIPVINLGVSFHTSEGERLLYLPSVFATIFISFFIPYIFEKNKPLITTIFIILVILFAIQLLRSNRKWHQAGIISRNITSDLQKIDKCNNIYFINLPDNLNGAFLFRQRGILKAINYYTLDKRFNKIHLVSTHQINSIKDSVSISFNKESKSVTVSNLSSPFYFNYFNDKDFTVSELNNDGFKINLTKLNPDDKIIYYSKGNLKEVDVSK